MTRASASAICNPVEYGIRPGRAPALSRSRLREKPGKLLLLRRGAEIERTTLKMLIGWNVAVYGDARENDLVFPSPRRIKMHRLTYIEIEIRQISLPLSLSLFLFPCRRFSLSFSPGAR